MSLQRLLHIAYVMYGLRRVQLMYQANEDHNLYSFDMRKLDRATCIHQDHVYAVMSVDYAPTGKEFVSGSYDRTVRIFGSTDGHSREVYHTKRMQRVFAVKFTLDNKYVLSGSDDFNVRIWKARAAERIGVVLPRERTKLNYVEKLKERFKHAPEIRRIARHRHVPSNILSAKKLKHEIKQAKAEKLRRVKAHSKPGAVPNVAEREKVVTKQYQ